MWIVGKNLQCDLEPALKILLHREVSSRKQSHFWEQKAILKITLLCLNSIVYNKNGIYYVWLYHMKPCVVIIQAQLVAVAQ